MSRRETLPSLSLACYRGTLHIFRSLDINAAFIEGDSFHRYTRPEMDGWTQKTQERLSEKVLKNFKEYLQEN